MSPDWFYPVISVMYMLVSWHFWRTRWRGVPFVAGWESFALLIPLALHLWLLHSLVSTPQGWQLGVGNVVSMIAALSVLVYWLSSYHMRTEALHVPIALIAAGAVLVSWALPSEHLMNDGLWAFKIHLIIALLAYSLLMIAALYASLMAVMEKHLHHIGQSRAARIQLPPLLTIERVLFRLISVGFVLLSLSVLSGAFFSERIFHKPFEFNHKTIFSMLSWSVYAILLWGHLKWGWRGRVAVRWVWIGFVMLVLAYIGTHFILEVVLHRSSGK